MLTGNKAILRYHIGKTNPLLDDTRVPDVLRKEHSAHANNGALFYYPIPEHWF